jgi:FkbM family methyltransferase
MLQRVLEKAEASMGRLLGKGWGAFVPSREVALIVGKVGNPQIVVDVGGNVGDWTGAMLASAAPHRILVVEPSQTNIDKLRARFGEHANVTIVPHALSDRDAQATLFSDAAGSGMASLHQRQLEHRGISHAACEEVSLMSCDTFLAEFGIEEIDVLKLDIEGHELEVLRQFAGDFLGKIGAIQFEFGGCNIDSRTYFRDFWQLLSPQFTFYRMSPLGLFRIKSYRERDETFTTTNYLCINSAPTKRDAA